MAMNYINEVAIKMLNPITSQSQSSVATMSDKKGKSSKEKAEKPEEHGTNFDEVNSCNSSQLDFTKRIISLIVQ